MPDSRIHLGSIARDPVTGFQGVVICIAHWLGGSCRVSLQPQTLKAPGEMLDHYTFDADRLQPIEIEEPKGDMNDPET